MRTVSELQRLAFIYAEQDRLTFLEAISNCARDPVYAKLIADNEQLVKELREYRQKRWGKTVEDALRESDVEPVSIEELRKRSQPTH